MYGEINRFLEHHGLRHDLTTTTGRVGLILAPLPIAIAIIKKNARWLYALVPLTGAGLRHFQANQVIRLYEPKDLDAVDWTSGRRIIHWGEDDFIGVWFRHRLFAGEQYGQTEEEQIWEIDHWNHARPRFSWILFNDATKCEVERKDGRITRAKITIGDEVVMDAALPV